jgi:membrane protease YdiL (CAAX protease family)
MNLTSIRIPVFYRWAEILAVGFLLHLAVSGLWPTLRPHGAIAFLLLFFLSVQRRPLLFSMVLVVSLWHWLPSMFSNFVFAPVFHFLLPILLTLPVFLFVPRSAEHLAVWKKGEIDSVSIFFSILLVVVSALALLLWASISNNLGAGLGLVRDLHEIPKLYLYFFVPVFALFIATVEEVTYRGIVQGGLSSVFTEAWYLPIFLSALLFASAHFANGFPNGPWGFAMTFFYGLGLGYLRWRTGGLLLSFVSHFCADLVIGFVLVFLAG